MRLILLRFIAFPGINDPNHYYNLGVRLLHGHGFTMDYLWHYNFAPPTLEHPFDFWQPLAGILAGLGMFLLGEGVTQALVPFVILGSLLPLVSYVAARQLACPPMTAVFVALWTALLPEFVLNSLRTDTLIPNALMLGGTFVCLLHGWRTGKRSAFLLSGIFGGGAYLARGDNLFLLPMLLVSLCVYALVARQKYVTRKTLSGLVIALLAALVVISPWVIRNLNAFGHWSSTPPLDKFLYFTEFRDHYHYERTFSLETLLASQTVPQLLFKRLFEAAAAIRMMITTLDGALPMLLIVGAVLVVWHKDRERLLTLMPPLVLLGGFYVAYVVLMPIANQGGSYKKSYLSLVPLLLPLGAYALNRLVARPAYRYLLQSIIALLLLQSSIMLVAHDIQFTATYLATMQRVQATLNTLPDTNDDDKLIIMAQDPFMLRYLGFQAVQIPMEDRATILAVAERYQVDYVLFPPARPALDGIYEGTETDARFIKIVPIDLRSSVYGFDWDASDDQ